MSHITRVYILCEGQTEEAFVKRLLMPHFQQLNIWLIPIVIRTSSQSRGGVSTYGKIKREIEKLCKTDKSSWVTTMLDFYGLPKDFPALDSKGDSLSRITAVEAAFQADIEQSNFIANIIRHEFEGLLFSEPSAFNGWDDLNIVSELTNIRNSFDTPEYINDAPETAPSKRILAICSNYQKVLHGSLISIAIGLDKIRQECHFFDAWIRHLESLAPQKTVDGD